VASKACTQIISKRFSPFLDSCKQHSPVLTGSLYVLYKYKSISTTDLSLIYKLKSYQFTLLTHDLFHITFVKCFYVNCLCQIHFSSCTADLFHITFVKWFYVTCWGEIKISFQFITLFGFHSGGNFSLSAGGCCASSGSRLAGSHLGLCSRRSVKITSEMTFCFSLFNQLAYSFFYIYDEVVHVI